MKEQFVYDKFSFNEDESFFYIRAESEDGYRDQRWIITRFIRFGKRSPYNSGCISHILNWEIEPIKGR